MDTPPTRFVARAFTFEHLDHQTLAAVLDRLVEEELDLVDRRGVLGLRKGEFAFDRLKMFTEKDAAFVQVLPKERLESKERDIPLMSEKFRGVRRQPADKILALTSPFK